MALRFPLPARGQLPSLIFSLLLASFARSKVSSAAPLVRTASLEWIRRPGAETCVDSATLPRLVSQRMGRAVFVASGAGEARVVGTIAPRADLSAKGWQARIEVLTLEGSLGVRELSFASGPCSDATAAIVLVIAVTLDPDHPLEPPPPEAAPVAPPPPPVLKPWLHATVGAGLGLGPLPAPFAVFQGRALIEPMNDPALAISFAVTLPRHQDATAGAQVEFFGGFIGAAWVAGHYQFQHLALRCLLGAEGGRVTFAGQDFDESNSGGRWTAALTAGLDARLALTDRLHLLASADGLVPLRRDRYYYAAPTAGTRIEVFRTAAIGTRLWLGLGTSFR